MSQSKSPEEEEVFSALVAYEDATTRDRAMGVCDRIVQKFWKDVGFDFSWWRFDFLRDSEIIQAAAQNRRAGSLHLERRPNN